MILPTYLSVPCPTCGSLAGESCTTGKSPHSLWRNKVRPHSARRKAFKLSEKTKPVKLLPCPFCGAEPHEPSKYEDSDQWQVACSRCPALMGDPAQLCGFTYVEDAISAWNTRELTAAKD